MEKINRHNYAVFFIDYFDNELTQQDTQALVEFLDLNPDLKEEFDSFINVRLPIESTLKLTNKPQLKKHIDQTNIEHYIIAELEGELAEDDQQEFTDFIAENTLYASTIERYKRTILPKEGFIYPHKSKLKQKSKTLAFWPYLTSIAAAVLIFIVLTYKKETQQYQFQALQNTNVNKELVNDSLSTAPDLNKQNSVNKVIPTIANKINFKKKSSIKTTKKKDFTPTIKIDSTIEIPKKEIELNKEIPLPLHPELENNITLAENPTAIENNIFQPQENSQTLKQLIHNTIKTTVFKTNTNKKELINKEYLRLTATEKINDSKNISFEQEEVETRKKTRLKIGKFEFYSDKGV